jgi:hypothetical protein
MGNARRTSRGHVAKQGIKTSGGKAAAVGPTSQGGAGQKSELSWIKLSYLFIPTEYQLSVKSRASANISHISAHFNWADCGAGR